MTIYDVKRHKNSLFDIYCHLILLSTEFPEIKVNKHKYFKIGINEVIFIHQK